jgi:NAD(P)-dependent dehydrogenase (short-subunit alcohol dehydrogenase family)
MMADVESGISGRHIVVTGASRGLGREMALALARAGARITGVALHESPQLHETLLRAEDLGAADRFRIVLGDLADWPDCARVHAQAVKSFGVVQVLINNAGIPMAGPGQPFWLADVAAWRQMAYINVFATFFLTRSIVPSMVSSGFGKVINISTGVGTMVRKYFSPYGPSKAFVETESRIWAQELADTGVTVNVLIPGGAVDTAADVTGVATPGRTFLPASVVVAPAVWLASDHSNGYMGLRLNASLWEEAVPIADRIARANQTTSGDPGIM